MYTKYIQIGNEAQCGDNSIPGWEYRLGVQESKLKTLNHDNRYRSVDPRDRTTTKWSIAPQYATSFVLILIK